MLRLAERTNERRDGVRIVVAVIDYREKIIKRSQPRRTKKSYSVRSKGHSRGDRAPRENCRGSCKLFLTFPSRRNINDEQMAK